MCAKGIYDVQKSANIEYSIKSKGSKYDAKIFTIQSLFDQAESERETEFGLMKDLMKKLVHALEDRAGADLI